MRNMLRYLFKPSGNDREAIKSAYYESVGPTQVTMVLAFLAGAIFLALTFIYPPYFGGTTVLYHQICYVSILAIATVWMIGCRYAMKDYSSRFHIVFVLNHFLGISLHIWVISLVIVNSLARGTCDTTLFMTVALVVPLCVYILPIVSFLIALL